MPAQTLNHSQSQNFELRTAIAPQMQQSLGVLQASTLELNQMIGQELSANPVLEEESVEISLEEEKLDKDQEDLDEELSEISQLDDDWRDYYQQSRSTRMRTDEENEKYQRRIDSLVEPQTLTENLTEQLNTTDCEKDVHELTQILIGYIDDDGFLSQNIEDLALENGIPFQPLQKALNTLQSFHPPGIGAQDLRECLLIQLNRLGKEHSLEHRIVDKYLDELARKRYPQISKKLGVTIDKITEAAESIAKLDPKPGSELSEGNNHFISPDVTVIKYAEE